MYDIYYDDIAIGSLAVNELTYFSGNLKQRVNEADTLTFSLTGNNPYLKYLSIRSGLVSLQKNGETVFVGDIVDMTADFYNCVTITCHGCLTWLKDVQIVHYSKSTNAANYLSDLLAEYNAVCSSRRQISMGYCDIDNSVNHDHSESVRSVSYLINEILEECGGYLMPRYNGQTVFLDWLANGLECNQNINSENLIDLSKRIDSTSIVTRIYPWGKDGLTMAAPYYVADDVLETYYGIIAINKKYDDANTAAKLEAKAQAELAKQKALLTTITMTAVDLSLQNRYIDSFGVASRVQVFSKPHGLEETMIVQEMDIDLNNSANSKVTFGTLEAPLSLAVGTSGMTEQNVRNMLAATDSKLNGSGTVSFASVTTDALTTKGEVEIYGSTPHVDMHFGNSSSDYTTRIIEQASGQLNVLAPNGLLVNGKKIGGENVTLTVLSSRLTDLSYTAKYYAAMGMVFVRIYGVVNVDMTANTRYNILQIGSHPSGYVSALTVNCSKGCLASVRKDTNGNGVIAITPTESGIKTYSVWISGFWFA